jgi:hypothetical protein
MSVNFELWLGTTWTINGLALKPDGSPLDLTGGTVELRIASNAGLIVKLASPNDILIQPGNGGIYIVTVDPTDARQVAMTPGTYRYEVVVTTISNGATAISVQNVGRVTIHKSLKQAFPG